MPGAAECRNGAHDFAPPVTVGAGIERSTCRGCGAVTIDLSDEQGLSDIGPGLFAQRKVSMYVGGLTMSDLLAPAGFGAAQHRR